MVPEPLDPAFLLQQAGWVRTLVHSLVRDEDLAEEVVQDTWAAALERRPAGNGPGGLRAWLAAVARNLALRARRREAQRRTIEQSRARDEHALDAASEVERMQLQRLLAGAVLELDEPYRSAVILRHLDGLSSAEIARRQGCTSEAARQRVARGLAALRSRLEREFGGGGAWGLVLLRMAGGATNSTTVGTGTVLGAMAMGAKGIVGLVACVVVAALWWRGPSDSGRAPAPNENEGDVELLVTPAEDAPASLRTLARPTATLESSEDHRTPTRDVPPPSAKVLVGRIVDARARGLAGRVDFAAPPDENVTAATDGRFALELGSRRVPFEIAVTCEGFVPRRFLVESLEPLEIALAALPALEGRLLDPEGNPVTLRGQVRLVIDPGPNAARENRNVESDENGRFRFEALPLGRLVELWARVKGFASRELTPDLELVAEANERLDVELPRGAIVTGVVLDSNTGAPVGGAQVWAETLQFDESDLVPSTNADAQGRFRLVGVQSDLQRTELGLMRVFWLLGQAQGYVPAAGRAYAAQPSDDENYHFEITIQRAAGVLVGRVFDLDGSAARGAQVLGISSEGSILSATADAAGGFVLEELPPGVLGLWIQGSRGELRTEVNLGLAGEHHADFTLVAGDGVASGRVTDLDGKPVADVRVQRSTVFRSSSLSMATGAVEQTTDADGRYRFEGLLPGEHTVQVQAEGPLACSLPASSWFEVSAGEEVVRDFVIGPCETYAGRVEGGPFDIDELEVHALHPRTEELVEQTRVGADGTFRFRPLLAGEYEFVLMRDQQELDHLRVTREAASDIVLRAR
jgi:RNA polymerase sigma-70 factor (ECF subfamily)